MYLIDKIIGTNLQENKNNETSVTVSNMDSAAPDTPSNKFKSRVVLKG